MPRLQLQGARLRRGGERSILAFNRLNGGRGGGGRDASPRFYAPLFFVLFSKWRSFRPPRLYCHSSAFFFGETFLDVAVDD